MLFIMRKFIYKTLAFSFVALNAIVISSCDTDKLENAVDDFSVIVGLEPINTSAVLMIRDASTGELINDQVNLSFKATNPADLIDMFSDPLASAQTDKGLFTFGIANYLEPDPDNIFAFELNIESEGYLSATKVYELQDTGSLSLSVDLVPLDNAPSGIEILNQNLGTTAANGDLTDSIKLELNIGDEALSFAVAPGNRFLDENGQALVGSLSARASYFDPDEPAAMSALNDLLRAPANDSSVGVLGALDLRITDASGKVANSIAGGDGKQAADGSFILNFIINGTTHRELQNLLRLAYISPTTAERVILYSVPQVSSLPNGRVNLRYALNSQIFRTAALVYFSEQPCDSRLTVNRNGNEGELTVRITERGFFRSANLAAGRNILQLRNITRGTKTVIVTLSGGNHQETIDFCANVNPTINLAAPANPVIDADLRLNVSCKNPEQRLRVTNIPATSILFREQGAPSGTPWRVANNLAWDYDASTRVLAGVSCRVNGVTQGASYDFKAVYDNQTIEYSGEITGSLTIANEVIDHEACQ